MKVAVASAFLALMCMILVTDAQSQRATDRKRPPPMPTPDNMKLERRRVNAEQDGDANRDLEFELDISQSKDTPKSLPSVTQARRVYGNQIGRVVEEARKAGDETIKRVSKTSINPAFQVFSLAAYQKPVLKCCPEKWKYSCRSSSVRLSCFNHFQGGINEWCCPIWPAAVYFQRCMCGECARLTETCVHKGKCRSRYSRRSFVAVCYRFNQWGYLKYVTKYLPSSCYCAIRS